MAELVAWLNEGDLDSPVHVRASMAHLNLVKIHPWADGNGRTSRALSTLVFSREALMPSEFSSIEEWLGHGQNTYRYYDMLKDVGGEVWSPQRDAGPWICPGAHHMQAQTAKRRIEFFRDAWLLLVDQVEISGLDKRMAFALMPALAGGKVRRTMYQRDADLNSDTAMRDMKAMVRTGWLRSHGQARGRFYTMRPRHGPGEGKDEDDHEAAAQSVQHPLTAAARLPVRRGFVVPGAETAAPITAEGLSDPALPENSVRAVQPHVGTRGGCRRGGHVGSRWVSCSESVIGGGKACSGRAPAMPRWGRWELSCCSNLRRVWSRWCWFSCRALSG